MRPTHEVEASTKDLMVARDPWGTCSSVSLDLNHQRTVTMLASGGSLACSGPRSHPWALLHARE